MEKSVKESWFSSMPQPFKTFADTRVMLKAEISWWGECSGFEKRADLSSACWRMTMKMTAKCSENEIQNAKLLRKWRRKWSLNRKWRQWAAEAPRAFSRARLWPTGTCISAHGYENTSTSGLRVSALLPQTFTHKAAPTTGKTSR